MPNFTYRARDQSGTLQTGRLEAMDADEALAMLQHRGLIVLTVIGAGERGGPAPAKQFRRRLHRGVTLEDKILFCQQLSALLDAGIPLLRSLQTISSQIDSRKLLDALAQIRQDVQGGWTFRNAIAKHPAIFTGFWINLIETGEASGHLALSLKHLARYHESVRQIQGKAVTAMTYPAVLILAAMGAVMFFLLKIIPVFSALFLSAKVELPLLTRLVMAASNGVRHHFVLLSLGTAGAVYGLVPFARTPQGRAITDQLALQLPVFSRLCINLQVAQFARGLGTLLESGVPILTSLEIIERSASNSVYAKAIGEAKEAVREGRPMADPLVESGLFPPLCIQMVQVGEEIGELAKMLDRIAAFYEERVQTFVERMTTLFEPIAIVVMAAVIGTLVISMFLPIFGLANGMRG